MYALGWDIVITSQSQLKAERAAQSIGDNVLGLQLSINQHISLQVFDHTLSQKWDRLDVVVNNAGIIGLKNGLLNTTETDLKAIMDTNFYGSLNVSKLCLDLLKEANDARIINISSGMGALEDLSLGGHAAYRLSKAALNAQTILMAKEMAEHDIKVFSMCPGWVKTDMGGPDAPRSPEEGADTAVWLATAKETRSGCFYRDRKIISW
jgi:NAD(P)-dependent dehydrogenase (short-subunit alcohol dehydrogenase family)